MGFLDRLSDSKNRNLGESLASLSFTMCDHDQIQKLLKECNFSLTESIRFKFDIFLANFAVTTHAIQLIFLPNIYKMTKILETMMSMEYSYIQKLVPGNIRIGDFIVNNYEWEFLKKNEPKINPDTRTNSLGLLHMIDSYRAPKLLKAMEGGFDKFMSQLSSQPEEAAKSLGPASLLAREFVKNFQGSEENTNHLIVSLSLFWSDYEMNILEYCKKYI